MDQHIDYLYLYEIIKYHRLDILGLAEMGHYVQVQLEPLKKGFSIFGDGDNAYGVAVIVKQGIGSWEVCTIEQGAADRIISIRDKDTELTFIGAYAPHSLISGTI